MDLPHVQRSRLHSTENGNGRVIEDWPGATAKNFFSQRSGYST